MEWKNWSFKRKFVKLFVVLLVMMSISYFMPVSTLPASFKEPFKIDLMYTNFKYYLALFSLITLTTSLILSVKLYRKRAQALRPVKSAEELRMRALVQEMVENERIRKQKLLEEKIRREDERKAQEILDRKQKKIAEINTFSRENSVFLTKQEAREQQQQQQGQKQQRQTSEAREVDVWMVESSSS